MIEIKCDEILGQKNSINISSKDIDLTLSQTTDNKENCNPNDEMSYEMQP